MCAVVINFMDAGHPIILSGMASKELVVTLNDDFSTLVEHHYKAHGLTTAV